MENQNVAEGTAETNELELKFQELNKNFETYKEEQARIREEIKTNAEKRFFKEGASKIESKIKEIFNITENLTGDELFNTIQTKVKVKDTKEVEAEQKSEQLQKLEQLLNQKEHEFENFKLEQQKKEVLSKLESFATNVLNSGEYLLPDNTNITFARLQSAIKLTENFKIDFTSYNEPIILGEDNIPLYNNNGQKVTLQDKIKENLEVFFDKKQGEQKLILNGKPKVNITKSIEEIDKQLARVNITQEEYKSLLEQKKQIINQKQ